MLTAAPEVATGVQEALARRHPGESLGELAVMPGGRSGLTYRIRAGSHEYVVKAVPVDQRPVGRNDVLRQAVVLRALAGSAVPVPEVVATASGHPAWFAMTLVPGESIEPVLDDHELPAELVRARMLAVAGVLRRLHDVDTGALSLAPQPASGPAGELERWARTLRAVPEPLRPRGEELVALLARSVPDEVAPALVHGDLRLGNALCSGADLNAVIDWEIWGIGDPRIDLAWFLLFTDPAGFPGVGHPAVGLPQATELVQAYRGSDRDSDRDSDLGSAEPPELVWFNALARLKMAAIMGHNIKPAPRGQAPRPGAGAAAPHHRGDARAPASPCCRDRRTRVRTWTSATRRGRRTWRAGARRSWTST